MNKIEYCEQCGCFVEVTFDEIDDSITYCPECNCDMRGEENEDDHSFEERIEDGFNRTKEGG